LYIHTKSRAKVDRDNYYNDYIALEKLDFSWKKEDVKKIIKYVERGATIETIAGIYERHPEEVFLLFLDLARRGKIKPEHNVFELREE
jgi:hypothetical protein